MIRRPPRSTQSRSSAASDVYKRQNIDGTGRRQLTQGRYDDFDPRYLPNGDIVFLSTRKGAAIQCSLHNSESTRNRTQPDSYVRCGGDNLRPCAVFTLHAMDAQGCLLYTSPSPRD